MNPLETAIYNIITKNTDIKELITQVKTAEDQSAMLGVLNSLSMQLAGVIDAAVQGGVEKYREAFFDSTYLKEHPEHAPYIKQFKQALSDQLKILKQGLHLFSQKCDKSLAPLSAHLSKTYQQMCADLNELLQS